MKQAFANYRSLRHPRGLERLRVAGVLVLMACGSTEPIEKNLLFEGVITNAATGAPIAGAGISVGDGSGFVPAIAQSTTSDSQGHYTLSHYGCIYNPYVFAGASGYFASQAKVGCMRGSQTVNFSLTRDPQAP
ncbi:MAG: carboxypeptidase-like regulatory domain-containing protein [Gemmatimonadota bacterium]|nr:carboxypeptidase-like regulatory domain-containing protein [Gemmatimonadota bacterium]